MHIFGPPKPIMFHNNHTTFFLAIMETWTEMIAVDTKRKVRNPRHFKTKERLK